MKRTTQPAPKPAPKAERDPYELKDIARPKWRVIVSALVFILVIGGVTIANLVYRAPTVSQSERRVLKTLPELSWKTVSAATFMNEFEAYALDQFFVRDSFRAVKSRVLFSVFRQLDNNDIYIVDGSAAKIEKMNEPLIEAAARKIATVEKQYLQGINCYYAIIPDKGYFLAADGGYPTLDYDRLRDIMAQGLPDMTYIDLFGAVQRDDYFLTDLHWKQNAIDPVAAALLGGMGAQAPAAESTMHDMFPFYGVYYGQAALPFPPETLHYETSAATDGAVVRMLDSKTLEMYDSEMYHPDTFTGIDPYDIFLAGAQPLITIEYPDAETDRELYIFRDSFTSSLAPLLTGSYRKITLIDLRYLASPLLGEFIEFNEGSDALFLYGTPILNDSTTLLVQEKGRVALPVTLMRYRGRCIPSLRGRIQYER